MTEFFNRFIWACLLLAIFIPGNVLLCDELSDNQRKEIVDQLYREYQKDLQGVKDIKPGEVIYLLNRNKVVLIDVRTPAEMEISMLPGAVSMDDYLNQADKYKGLVAVAYCTIGYRSGIFSKKMAEKGFTVQNLAGGILAWVFEGGSVYHERIKVKRIHLYGSKWDYPPSGYESVLFNFFERIF